MNLMATLKDDDQNEFTNDASGDRLVSSVLQSAKPTASPRQGSILSERTGAYGNTPSASPARFTNGGSHSSTVTSPSVGGHGSPPVGINGAGGKVDGNRASQRSSHHNHFISINAGMLDGLPVGMMITGKWFEETKLLSTALAYEQVLAG